MVAACCQIVVNIVFKIIFLFLQSVILINHLMTKLLLNEKD